MYIKYVFRVIVLKKYYFVKIFLEKECIFFFKNDG